ncbi:MAG TPA: UvrD-helicase domain-containing protein [bacterium]|nr:UvrD-helicase domain-containing protein [bacterium]
MAFHADLHIHSKYSRATSSEGDLEHLALWAARKGLSVIGTGDFTHPAWLAEIKEKLVAAEPGLYRMRPELARAVLKKLPPALAAEARFMLTVEISTIYKKGERTRKVHHVIVVPDVKAAEKIIKALTRIGNLKSDGRPILGLDSRDLLEITLAAGEGSYLIPAHIWTPWFSVLGSKSGFDSIEECYADLAPHIFALETGLSSDPAMNWRLSALDRYRLVSNSDAHSPAKLGREACVFDTALDYFEMRRALETGRGYGGTIEFFPEEGKYHLDGHRKCNARLGPEETRRNRGRCPVCGKPVTVGVMNRVEELADRPEGARAKGAAPFTSLIPLAEIIAEILGCGAATKGVAKTYEGLTRRLGPELFILADAPLDDLRRAGSDVLAEAIARMRRGEVIREAGYDGEYGVIKLFKKGELNSSCSSAGLLFELPEEERLPRADAEKESGRGKKKRGAKSEERGLFAEPRSSFLDPPAAELKESSSAPMGAPAARTAPAGPLSGLDPEQAAAALITEGPVLIIAGPGTGKTRTLTHRIARLVEKRKARAQQCLAITFTRRAAAEMRDRLIALLPGQGALVPVMTFHSLGLSILTEHGSRLGLPRRWRVAAEPERVKLLMDETGASERKARKLLAEITRFRRLRKAPGPGSETAAALEAYARAMRGSALVDFDDLIALPAELLATEPDIVARCRERWPWVSIDEYQDIDETQYRLVKLLAPPDANLCAIGDPDQAIYSFRGADVGFFMRFKEDFPGARIIRLTRNYRSSRTVVDASRQVILPASLVADRAMEALQGDAGRIVIYEAATDKAEAEFVVHSIERMVGGSSFFSMDSGRVESGEGGDFSFGDFAVLYRTGAQAALLVEALARSGIPFQKRSHERLLDDPMAARIVDAMRGMEAAGSVMETLKRVEEMISAEVDGNSEDTARGTLEDVRAAVEMLGPVAERGGDDLAGFYSELALGVEVDALDPRADRVSLLTLHAAKGLEFRAVFIAGCEDGILPLKWGAEAADPDEERRLFFVGMTRARERLFLTRAGTRRWRGKKREMAPSPFLSDIEERLIAREKSRAGRKKSGPEAEQLDLF